MILESGNDITVLIRDRICHIHRMGNLDSAIDPLFVEEISDCAGRAGLDVAQIIRDVQPAAGPLTLNQYGQVWFSLARMMGDEMIGTMPYPLRPGGFALMCHTILAAPELRTALRRALWFMHVVTGLPEAALSTRNDMATVTVPGPVSAFACRTLLIVLLGPVCWLARRPIPLTEVAFPCAQPAKANAYSRLFGTPVSFQARALQVSFAATYLDLPVNRSEAALKRYLKQAPANLLVGYHGTDDLTGRIRAMLAARPTGDWPDFEDMAALYGMSVSTLRRQLRAEGSSYRDIAAALQLARAKRMLGEGQLSVAAIAEALNYAEPSAFFRAFRIATGTTPARYRQNLRRPPTVSDRNRQIPG
ncbi:AraC family transcriptional regulator [Paracoccus aestuarii]|nr:AraC family transcriptional regulator [Paracoccus aestuarii]